MSNYKNIDVYPSSYCLLEEDTKILSIYLDKDTKRYTLCRVNNYKDVDLERYCIENIVFDYFFVKILWFIMNNVYLYKNSFILVYREFMVDYNNMHLSNRGVSNNYNNFLKYKKIKLFIFVFSFNLLFSDILWISIKNCVLPL